MFLFNLYFSSIIVSASMCNSADNWQEAAQHGF
jgi:hypothetical protein